MKKNVVLIIGGVILLGIVAFFVLGKKPAASVHPVTPTPITQVNTGETNPNQPTSLKAILTAGVDETCTFSIDTLKGSAAVSGGKVRGDFSISFGNKVTQANILIDGSNSYIWTEGQTAGIKTVFNPESSTASGSAASTGFDANRNLNYNCTPGIASSTDFNIPAGISFREVTIPSAVPSK